MKAIPNLTIALIVCGMSMLTACTVDTTADEGESEQTVSAPPSTMTTEQAGHGLLLPLPHLDLHAIQAHLGLSPRPMASVIVPFSPAPPLSEIAMEAVGSTNCGWEFMTTIPQFSTTCDHGGAQLLTVTVEIGYGDVPVAAFNSSVLSSSANYATSNLCFDSSGELTDSCVAGETVVGFEKGWNVSGNQSGQFSYQDTSINSPFNTISTFINIR